MIAILIFSATLVFAYLALIGRFISGWNSLHEYPLNLNPANIKVSVIIAFRNEEENLPVLFEALEAQSYSLSEYEVIFADDHSDDHSAALVSEFVSSRVNARLINLENQEEGKKKALSFAASKAKGELLIFTDADCRFGKEWISSIVSCYIASKPVLIASPVIIKPGSGFMERFQSLEFFGLLGSTAGAFGLGEPIMVNGANLAINRDVYLESINFLQYQTLSGDDIFLLLHLKKVYPDKLIFLKSHEAIVSVKPQKTFLSFIQQRIRWGSKARYYRDFRIIYTAVIVLLVNLWLLNCFVMSFFNFQYIIIGAGVFLAKSYIDYMLLKKVLKFYSMDSLLSIFVLSQILYFLYISFTGFAGNFIPARWKGRTVKI